MTNAGFPVTIAGQEYLTTQLGQAAWEYLVNCLRLEFIQQQTKLLEMNGERANPNDVNAIRVQAFAFGRHTIASTNWFFSETGSVHLLHQLLIPKQPTISLNQCREWAKNGDFTADVMNICINTILAGTPIAKGEGGSDEGNPPTTPISTTS